MITKSITAPQRAIENVVNELLTQISIIEEIEDDAERQEYADLYNDLIFVVNQLK